MPPSPDSPARIRNMAPFVDIAFLDVLTQNSQAHDLRPHRGARLSHPGPAGHGDRRCVIKMGRVPDGTSWVGGPYHATQDPRCNALTLILGVSPRIRHLHVSCSHVWPPIPSWHEAAAVDNTVALHRHQYPIGAVAEHAQSVKCPPNGEEQALVRRNDPLRRSP